MLIQQEGARDEVYGQTRRFTIVERWGNWLSVRALARHVGEMKGKSVADIGCGDDALLLRSLLDRVALATLVDLKLAPDLHAAANVRAIEGVLPTALEGIPDESLDVVICNNVLEHLWEPSVVVAHVRRMLKPNGTFFANVPSWRGKFALETASFKLNLSPKRELDDHKNYYDARDLWRLVVAGGFKSSGIAVGSHKFGLNTFAVCRKETAA